MGLHVSHAKYLVQGLIIPRRYRAKRQSPIIRGSLRWLVSPFLCTCARGGVTHCTVVPFRALPFVVILQVAHAFFLPFFHARFPFPPWTGEDRGGVNAARPPHVVSANVTLKRSFRAQPRNLPRINANGSTILPNPRQQPKNSPSRNPTGPKISLRLLTPRF